MTDAISTTMEIKEAGKRVECQSRGSFAILSSGVQGRPCGLDQGSQIHGHNEIIWQDLKHRF